MSLRWLARLAIILGALLLLWGAAALVRRQETRPGAEERFTLPALGRAEADTLWIARPGDTTLLVRRDSTSWTVNGQPASESAVADLFAALADTGRPTELVGQRRASHPGFGVDSTGARVRLVGPGKVAAELILGHRTPDFSGGYFRRADDSLTYLVGGRLAELLAKSPDDWRDRRIARVAADSVTLVEAARGARSYTLRKRDGGWRIGDRPADSAAVAELLGAYREVEASGFAGAADTANFARPDRRIRLLAGDRPLLALELDSTTGGFWVRKDGGESIYRIESWTANRLVPADTAFRPRPK